MPSAWYSKSPDGKVTINVELFLSSTCPHCQKADAFFNEITTRHPDIHIQRYFINQDKNALFRFNQLLTEQHMDDFSVPSIYICSSRWAGFATAETTGKDLLSAIKFCKKQIENKGKLTEVTVNTLRHLAMANQFSAGLIEKPSELNNIISIAFMDAFRPCAFFCFAGFIAFLLIEGQRQKQIIASLLFILSVAIVHYYQQVYPSSYFALIPWLRIPAALLGLMTIYFVVHYYKKQSSSILYFLLAFLLGLIITIYQQTCLMSLSTIFEQWLNNQHLAGWQEGVYQVIYQSMYIFPLILILFAYVSLFKMKHFVGLRTRLTNVGLLFLIAIAVILIVYPMIFSNLVLSLLTLLILVVCGFFLNLT